MSMMQTSILLKITLALLLCESVKLSAQSKQLTYTYKQGQVLDIIFLNTKADVKEELDDYFKKAFPVANSYGYTGLGGIALSQNPSQGNYHPESMIFGVWTSLKERKDFLENIEKEMPEFHQSRRNIWSSFNLTYWEMENDLTFTVNRDKFTVVTAYWHEDKAAFQKFKSEWATQSKSAGGKEILVLTNGESPFGYHYNPDYLVISEWNSKSDFEKFYKKNLEMNHDGVKHVNQFIIQ